MVFIVSFPVLSIIVIHDQPASFMNTHTILFCIDLVPIMRIHKKFKFEQQ